VLAGEARNAKKVKKVVALVGKAQENMQMASTIPVA
jgi:hypothetical protein